MARSSLRTYSSGLPPHSEVDGHDFGSGEFNIFILTISQRKASAPLKKRSDIIALNKR